MNRWLWMIAGANGAGKSTAAKLLLPKRLGCTEFINADLIAAGRLMLSRIEQMLSTGTSFAFETTGASRTFVPLIKRAKQQGYEFGLIYLWLPTPELAIARVSQGGHDVCQRQTSKEDGRGAERMC